MPGRRRGGRRVEERGRAGAARDCGDAAGGVRGRSAVEAAAQVDAEELPRRGGAPQPRRRHQLRGTAPASAAACACAAAAAGPVARALRA
eukprot:scaffold2213_cov444-Prasinococcus_capsulatus_cf.AAC.13